MGRLFTCKVYAKIAIIVSMIIIIPIIDHATIYGLWSAIGSYFVIMAIIMAFVFVIDLIVRW